MTERPVDRFESSLMITIGVIAVFLGLAVAVILVAPRFVDESWMSPSSRFQVLVHEVTDPSYYISNFSMGHSDPEHVQHVVNGKTLFGYVEDEKIGLISEADLENYITKANDPKVKLTHRLLFLRASTKKQEAQKADHKVYELYDPHLEEGFVFIPEHCVEHWADQAVLLNAPTEKWQEGEGFVYVKNPLEYRVSPVETPQGNRLLYDPHGRAIKTLSELTGPSFGFTSRKDLIELGEHLYAIEGCWYCHTDQTRTLVQDVVLNGTDAYPAPPSSANEYIYQDVTFPGTRRIGPDISRVGVKRPSRDWHISHFWSPSTISAGSLMPSFCHYFEEGPKDKEGTRTLIPNQQFEAIYQYLLTKGTRITPPTEAWWLGKDPLKIKEMIEGNSRD